ncbi:MAG: hypothetical protein KY428_00050 [Bacteroidetes bacterium]|nr:hypothetical protein [Bacteroidota bacterium]
MKLTTQAQIYRLYDLWGTPVLAVAVGLLFVLEKKYALRKQQLPLLQRLKTNGLMVAAAIPVLRLALIPAQVATAQWAARKKTGLLHWLRLPPLAGQLYHLCISGLG